MTRRIDTLLSDLGTAQAGRRGVAGAAGLSILARSAQIILQIATVILLARFLSPDDFGLFGMVTPILAFFLVFRDAGLGLATLQSTVLSERQSSTLFYLNVIVGLGLAFLFFALSWPLASLYGDDRFQGFAAWFGVLFLLSGMRAQHEALLFRSYRFGIILGAELLASTIGLTLSVVAAWGGWSYWSLLVRQLAYEACYAVILLGYVRWMPRQFSIDHSTVGMLKFGANVALSSFVTFFLRNIDNVLIGWRFGAGPLGLYAVAYRTVLFPIQQFSTPLSRVMIPHLSGVRDDARKLSASFLAGLRILVSLAGLPLVVFWIFAEELIGLLLGGQWDGVVEIARWLIPAGFAQVVMIAAGWTGLSLQRSRKNMIWSLVSAPVVLTAFGIGLQWGPVGVAAGYAIGSWLLVLPCFVYFLKGTGISMAGVAWAASPGACSMIGIAGALWWVKDAAATFSASGVLNPLVVIGCAISFLVAFGCLFLSATLSMRSLRLALRAGA